MSELLSIVIPSYNRRDKLVRQLRSIFDQEESSSVRVVICDNHSNYDVRGALSEEFPEDVLSKTTVVTNKVNLGMHANLALLFLRCETPWMWTLSDDDETLPHSIATILSDIETFPDTVMFKYQIEGYKHYDDREFTNLPDLLDFYQKGHYDTGHLIFLSNNVYNMKYAMQCYGDTLSRCACDIAQMLPMFYALDSGTGVVRFREKALVRFVMAPNGEGWPYLRTANDFSMTPLYRFNLSDRYCKKLGAVLMNNFPHYMVILSALNEPDRKRGKFLYSQIYSRSYKYSGRFIDKLYHIFFYFCYVTHFQVSREKALKIRERMRKVFKNIK